MNNNDITYMHLSNSILVFISLSMFIIMYGIMIYTKPSIVFYEDGNLREFGIGYKNKTICPLWIASILLGALCYLFVLYAIYIN